jgi:xylulokinase
LPLTGHRHHNCNKHQGTIQAARQALAQVDASAVRAVGVSGQQHGMVVLDAQDKVLRPAKVCVWCDSLAAAVSTASCDCACGPRAQP